MSITPFFAFLNCYPHMPNKTKKRAENSTDSARDKIILAKDDILCS